MTTSAATRAGVATSPAAKLLYLMTEDWFFCSHFAERAVAARDAGYDVIVLARENAHGSRIRAMGLRFVPIPILRGRINPFHELKTIAAIWRIYRTERPDILHHIALKPILYGSLAARLLGIRRIVNAPVGVGYIFANDSVQARILRAAVRPVLRWLLGSGEGVVVFENDDDGSAAVAEGMIRRDRLVIIRGAGIDVDAIVPAVPPPDPPVVVLVARMLRDKGVVEFVDAARQLRRNGVAARFLLVGAPDDQNPTSLTETDLRALTEDKVVEWLGHRDDVPAILRQCHIACLPSYREGLPKALLEAMAAGLPIVTTDVVGCRDLVTDGSNGFLVPPRNATELAAALPRLIADRNLRAEMGARGRARVEREFSSKRVIAETLALYAKVGGA